MIVVKLFKWKWYGLIIDVSHSEIRHSTGKCLGGPIGLTGEFHDFNTETVSVQSMPMSFGSRLL